MVILNDTNFYKFVFLTKYRTTPREMFVRLGAYDFTDDASATGEDHEIEHFNIHPQYDRQG